MKMFSFLSGPRIAAAFDDLRWRVGVVATFFLDDPQRLFSNGVFPALHLATLSLLLILAVLIQDNKGLYFTQVALLHQVAYKSVCTRYSLNGPCAEIKLWRSQCSSEGSTFQLHTRPG